MTEAGTGEKKGFFGKIGAALRRTSSAIAGGLSGLEPVFRQKGLTPELLDQLEGALLSADLGVVSAREAVAGARRRLEGRAVDGLPDVLQAVREEFLRILAGIGAETRRATGDPGLRIVFFVGVNGVGKTTAIGKIAVREARAGRKVVLAAADTFRAAAVEQLEIWGGRAGADVVHHRAGSDPAAVVFDAVVAAKSRGADLLLVDTAGRLHTKGNLMRELEKMRRVAEKEGGGLPIESLLVLDATTGQNGLRQAEEFGRSAGLTGIVLTKLDGTAKGGIALAAARQLDVPIRWVGLGEGPDDIAPFEAQDYVNGLLGLEGNRA